MFRRSGALVLAAAALWLVVIPAGVPAAAAGAASPGGSRSVVTPADSCTTPPEPPINVRASGGFSPTTIITSWTIVPPGPGCTLAAFEVFRAGGVSGGVFVRVAQTPPTATSFTDMQLQPATTYRYHVRSRTTNGLVSGPSAVAQATTADRCFPQLPFPPALSVLGVTPTSVSLAWTGSNPACVVFDVQRATGAAGTTFVIIGTTSGSTFVDGTVSPATTYRYRVRARIVTTGMVWGFTSIVTVTTP